MSQGRRTAESRRPVLELNGEELAELQAYIEPLQAKLYREALTDNAGNLLVSLVAIEAVRHALQLKAFNDLSPVEASRIVTLAETLLPRMVGP